MSNITTQSRIKTARKCWRRHWFKYVEKIARKLRAAPLFRGSILHEMSDARIDKKDPFKTVLTEYEKKYHGVVRANPEEYGLTFFEDIRRIFDGYERAYETEPLKYLYKEKIGKVEMPNGIELSYTVDAIVKDKNDRRWLLERKSHKNIPDDRSRFSDIQTVLYFWAWNTEHPKEQVDGIIWDYVRTKPPAIPETLKAGGLTQRKDIDTDWYTYVTELRRLGLDPRPYKETLDRLKARGSSSFFQRISLPSPTAPVVKSIVADAAETALEIKQRGDSNKTRNLSRECSWCEFFDLCHAELRGLDADFIRKTKYEERDPDERYAKEEE